MNYYLLDASALVLRYDRIAGVSDIIDELYIQQLKGEAFFYIPNFCITETFNTFAKFYFREKKITRTEYNKYLRKFREHIRFRKSIYPYALNRYHNYIADEILPIEHKTKPLKGNKSHLSTFDILIIAMGIELKNIHIKDNVYIITRDERLANVSNSKLKLPKAKLPKAIYIQNARLKTKTIEGIKWKCLVYEKETINLYKID